MTALRGVNFPCVEAAQGTGEIAVLCPSQGDSLVVWCFGNMIVARVRGAANIFEYRFLPVYLASLPLMSK